MDANVVVAKIGKEKYVTTLLTERHQLVADEDATHGGSDQGPAPGDLLRMSLASCTAITLRMYVDRKQWDIDEISVSVSSKMIDGKTIFTREITVSGTADVAQRERLTQVANACPVHKVLTSPIEIQTSLH